MTESFLLADTMASGIHDVRNCLFAAESNLLPEGGNPALAREMILEAAARLNRMLTAYHLLRHEQQLNMAAINVGALIEDAILQASETSRREVPIAASLAYVNEWIFSREEINDLLVNALQNACKYSRQSVEIHTRTEGAFLVIEVHDDGPGYPPSPIPARPDAKGHGIGLFIAMQVARHHCRQHDGHPAHGKITLGASPRLGGALFTLQLP